MSAPTSATALAAVEQAASLLAVPTPPDRCQRAALLLDELWRVGLDHGVHPHHWAGAVDLAEGCLSAVALADRRRQQG